MNYDHVKNTLFTASKDKKMTLWQLPESWFNDEIRQFEQNEIKNINDNLALLKMQKSLTKMWRGG